MQQRRWIPLAVFALLGLGAVGAAWRASAPAEAPEVAPQPTANSVRGLLHAQAFRLERPYVHTWRAEQPLVSAGWVLVLAVDPALVVRRQLAEALLVVGEQTAERINDGDRSGRLVVIVPARLDAQSGLPDPGPLAVPAWFAEAALPEQTGAADLQRALAAARTAGVADLGAGADTRSDAVSGELLELADRTALERHAAGLVLVWSPEERELAEGLLAPLVE